MKKITLSFLAIATLLLITVQAQTPPPPRVVRIYREEVKPGLGPAHAKVEANWPRVFAKAKYPVNYLGMTSMSGPNEAWFLEGHESWAAIEKGEAEIDKQPTLKSELDQLAHQDSSLLSSTRTMIATRNDDLSRFSSTTVAQMRYFSVTTYRVRPGYAPEFTEFRKIIKTAHETAKTNNHFALYQVVSGAAAGTYLLFRPLKSLQELDPDPSRPAILGPEEQRKLNELARMILISSETSLFALSPGMSYMSEEFMAVDPAFWKPKPRVVAKPAAKKEAEKTGGTQ